MSSGGRLLPQENVAQYAAEQFCYIYHRHKDLQSEGLLWGDEIEYLVVSVNEEDKSVSLLPCASHVHSRAKSLAESNGLPPFVMPEFAEFQLETIPPQPYNGGLEDLGAVEGNMRERRRVVQSLLPPNTYLLTITSFPRLGREMDERFNGIKQTTDWNSFDNFMCSKLKERNIRILTGIKNRVEKPYGFSLPVFQDVNTRGNHGNSDSACHSGQVTIGGATIALGCNGLHVTIQAKDLHEARYLHDQLVVLSPVLICLTVATPVVHGLLNENDSRLGLFQHTLDDRTEEEKKPVIDKTGEVTYKLPRVGPVTWYLSEAGQNCNDLKLAYDVLVHDTCVRKGMDRGMAMYAAILFSHPFYAVNENETKIPEKDSTQLIESINSSVWSYVRLKITDPSGQLGWRIEFRPMAVQPTDFENAAYAVFIFLLTRTMRHFSFNFLIPMSKVHENCQRSLSRDAIRNKKFHFRTNYCDSNIGVVGCEEMSVDDIVNGSSTHRGLLSLVRQFLDTQILQKEIRQKIDSYLRMISQIASGERPTVARRIRELVLNHPEYKKDSEVTERIQYEIVKAHLLERL